MYVYVYYMITVSATEANSEKSDYYNQNKTFIQQKDLPFPGCNTLKLT